MKIKRFLALLLAFVMVIGVLPLSAMAAIRVNNTYQQTTQTMTKTAGETEFIYILPTYEPYTCGYCGTSLGMLYPGEDVPSGKYYGDVYIDIDDASKEIIGDYGVTYENHPTYNWRAVKFNYTAKKAGVATFTLKVQAYFYCAAGRYICPSCGRRNTVSYSQTWLNQYDCPYEITVESDENAYQVIFDKNTTDDVSGMPENLNWTDANDPSSFTVPNNEPTRDGYTFKGWSSVASSTTAGYTKGMQVSFSLANSPMTLYAVWEQKAPENITYELHFDGNTSDEVQNVPETMIYTGPETSHTFTVSETVPTRAGYHFHGWVDIGNQTSNITFAGSDFTVQKDRPIVTLRASWLHCTDEDDDGFCDTCGQCMHDKDDDGFCTVDGCTHDETCCPKKEADENNDGIPDKYQVTVTFQVTNGLWNDGSSEDKTIVVTLRDDNGQLSENGSYTLTANDVPSVGEKPLNGCVAYGWWHSRNGTLTELENGPAGVVVKRTLNTKIAYHYLAPVTLTLTVEDKTAEYTGAEQFGYGSDFTATIQNGSKTSCDAEHVTASNWTIGAPTGGSATRYHNVGDVIHVSYTPAKGTAAGEYTTDAYSYTVTRGAQDVTGLYNITINPGKLTITQNEQLVKLDFMTWDTKNEENPYWRSFYGKEVISGTMNGADGNPIYIPSAADGNAFKDGWKFAYWALNTPDGTGEKVTLDSKITEDSKAYPAYTTTLAFMTQNSDGTWRPFYTKDLLNGTMYDVDGNPIWIPTAVEGHAEREGYTFIGWVLGSLDGTEFVSRDTVITGPTQAYPAWEANIPEAPTYDALKALFEGKIQVICVGDTAHKSEQYIATSFTIGEVEGDAETGYTCKVTLDCTAYVDEDHQLVATQAEKQTITLTWNGTSWTAPEVKIYEECVFDVTFMNNGEVLSSAKVPYGQKAETPEDPTNGNATFLGWYTEDGELYDFDTPVTKSMTLTAKWEEKAPVYVNVYRDGNTSEPAVSVKLGDYAKGTPYSEILEKAGYLTSLEGLYTPYKAAASYEWDGVWSHEASNLGHPIGDGTVNGWTNLCTMVYDVYNVNYHVMQNGEELESLTETITTKTLETYTLWNYEVPEGHSFDGWYQTTKDFGIESRLVKTPLTLKKYELYANLEAIEFTVTFDANGGTPEPEAQTVVYGQTATQPSGVKYVYNGTGSTSFTLAGWFTEDHQQWDFSTPVTGNMTLTAVWLPVGAAWGFDGISVEDFITFDCVGCNLGSALGHAHGKGTFPANTQSIKANTYKNPTTGKYTDYKVEWSDEYNAYTTVAKLDGVSGYYLASIAQFKGYSELYGESMPHQMVGGDRMLYLLMVLNEDGLWEPAAKAERIKINNTTYEIGEWEKVGEDGLVVDVECGTPVLPTSVSGRIWVRDEDNTKNWKKYTKLLDGTWELDMDSWTFEDGYFYVTAKTTEEAYAQYVAGLSADKGVPYVLDLEKTNETNATPFTFVLKFNTKFTGKSLVSAYTKNAWIWDTTTVSATIRNNGYTVWAVHDHAASAQHFEAVAPTCEEDGNIEYWYCAYCNKYYADAACTKEIEKDSWILPATGHDWQNKGTIEATCTTPEYTLQQCANDPNHIQQIVTGDALGHDYKTVVTEPTCTEGGYTTYTCNRCGETHIDDITAPKGHNWGEAEVVTEPGCASDGVKRFTCQDCGATKEENIGASGHDFVDTKHEPTCTECGWITHTCTKCGYTYDSDHVAALGHDYQAAVVAPTCTEVGYTRYTCQREGCGHSYTDEIVQPLGHDLKTETEPATCTTMGKTWNVCQREGCDYKVLVDVTDALGHDWSAEWTIDEAPTCETAGSKSHHCTRCDAVTDVTEIPALGHDWDEGTVTTPATCEADGVLTYTCKNDSSHTYTEVIPALGHDWDEGKVTKEATCEEDGVLTYTCKNDSTHTYTEPIPAIGHDWDEGKVTKAPTCTEAGVKTYTCKNDPSHTKTEAISATGHSWDNGKITKYPTYTQEGVKTYTCRICGETRTEAIPKLKYSPVIGAIAAASSAAKVTPELNKADHVAYIIGYSDGTIRPNGTITRAEAATIFFRLMTDDCREAYRTTKNSFYDVAVTDWYNTAVSTLANAGVIIDSDNGYFRPNEAITRAELAAMAAQFSDATVRKASSFSDVPVSYWAADEIALVEQLGWITGYPDGTFGPNKTITRAEAMAIINRMLDRGASSGNMISTMRTWSDNKPGDWYYEIVQEATNSHTYTVKSGVESWTRLTADPDWTKYEK